MPTKQLEIAISPTWNTADNHVRFLGHGHTQGQLGIVSQFPWEALPQLLGSAGCGCGSVCVPVCLHHSDSAALLLHPQGTGSCTYRVTAENWAPCDSPKIWAPALWWEHLCFCYKRLFPMASACRNEPADSCSMQVLCELPLTQHLCPF